MSGSRTPTVGRDLATLIDLRPVQDGEARASLVNLPERRFGLVDPDLPTLDPLVAGSFSALFSNAYAAAHAPGWDRMRLADRADRLFAARLALDAGISRLPDRADRQDALGRYWCGIPEQAARADGFAVLTLDASMALCSHLREAGAELFRATPFPLLSPTYRHALFIVSNTRESSPLLYLLHRYGGDLLLTDPCLLAAYDDTQARRLAELELGRTVPASELGQWREGIALPSALFLGEAMAAARRVFVSSELLADEIVRRFGREAVVVPVPSSGPMLVAYAAGLWAEACVWALEMLVDWGVDLQLALVCPEGERVGHLALAARLGVGARVRFELAVASVVAALGMRGQGPAPVSALQAGAVPLIVSRSVREAMSVSGVVLPDQASAPLLAEAVFAALGGAAAAGASGAREAARAIVTGLR